MPLTRAGLACLAAVLVLVAASVMAASVAPPAPAEQASGMPGPPRAAAALIDAGTFHSCAIKPHGTAWCWGFDGSGQLGNGEVLTGEQPSPSAVSTTGPIPDTWTAISAGDYHTCALAADGTAWCWGSDSSGQLGNSAALTANQPSPSAVDTSGPILPLLVGLQHLLPGGGRLGRRRRRHRGGAQQRGPLHLVAQQRERRQRRDVTLDFGIANDLPMSYR